MKTNYLLLLFVPFILFGCEDEESNDVFSKNPPETPEAVNYDLNDDSANDIKVDYRWFTWDGIKSSGDGIYGLIEPLNESSILLKRNVYTLFNELNDTIRLSPNEPYYWEKYLLPVVSILNSSVDNYLWPKAWKIQSNKTVDSYYLGIKMNKNNTPLVGWIQLKIDTSTGAIQILDKRFTTEDYIVIEK